MTDWLKATKAEREAQYEVFKRICKERRTSFDRLIRVALSGTEFGSDYESGCRRGKMSATNARDLAQWIATNHPAHAAALEAALEDARAGKDNGRAIVARDGDIKVLSYREDGSASVAEIDAAIRNLYSLRNREQIRRRVFGDSSTDRE